MNSKQFFIGKVVVSVILLIIGFIIFATVSYPPQNIPQPPTSGEKVVPPVEKKPTPVVPTPKPTLGKCYVGGCSAQVCSDEEGMMSTCEYRPEYACYKKSTCERQATGKCGWTANKELNACLASSSSVF